MRIRYGTNARRMRRPSGHLASLQLKKLNRKRNERWRGGKWANAALLNGYAEAEYNDNLPHGEYVAWQRQCLTQMMRVLKPNGAIFYNHKWRVQAGLLQDRADIVEGFPVRQIIIWRRNGGINFNKGYFLPTFEVIYMIAKKDFVLAKGANSRGDIWDIGQELKNEHPAPFPIALIERVISSTDAQIILDPFMGSGTTAIAAKKLGRDFIGIELSKSYINLAQKRLKEVFMEPATDQIGRAMK